MAGHHRSFGLVSWGTCPENSALDEYYGGEPPHTVELAFESEGIDSGEQLDGVIEAKCLECGDVVREWNSRREFIESSDHDFVDIGVCEGCGDVVVVGGHLDNSKEGEEYWHTICKYRDVGYEYIPQDEGRKLEYVPRYKGGDHYDLHKVQSVEIVGEAFEWDVWVFSERGGTSMEDNLPTRSELSPTQLEQLREWATGDNPTTDNDDPEAEFPARFVLLGNFDSKVSDKWICPECGSIVEPKDGDKVDLMAECGECGSNKWVTEGEVMYEPSTDWWEPLSDRELQTIHLRTLGDQVPTIASKLDIGESSVREYLQRARKKAREGKRLYDSLEVMEVIS